GCLARSLIGRSLQVLAIATESTCRVRRRDGGSGTRPAYWASISANRAVNRDATQWRHISVTPAGYVRNGTVIPCWLTRLSEAVNIPAKSHNKSVKRPRSDAACGGCEANVRAEESAAAAGSGSTTAVGSDPAAAAGPAQAAGAGSTAA